MDEGDYIVPEDWFDKEIEIFDNLISGDPEVGEDFILQDLFDTAMFDMSATSEEREEAYQAMVEYLWDAYDIDFEAVFDWDDWREWYGEAA